MSVIKVRREERGRVLTTALPSRFRSLVVELPMFRPTLVADFIALTTNLGFLASNRVENKNRKAPPATGTVIASPSRLPNSNVIGVAVLYF